MIRPKKAVPRTRKPHATSKFRVSREARSLRSMTVTSLRKAILSLHFTPGERLTEKALCELTGVSRSLMREALRDLEAQGLINNVPHRGPVVATLTRRDAIEIYEVRSALEPMAARLFVERAGDEQVVALDKQVLQCQRAMEESDILNVIDALENFYLTLFAGAGNRTAAMLAHTLHTRASLLRAITFQQQTRADARRSVAYLRQIVSAIRNRNAEQAAEACLGQIKRSRRVAMNLLKDKPEPRARDC